MSSNTWVLPVLGLMFIALKLCHVITWSWWLILMPFFAIPLVIFGMIAIPVSVAIFVAFVVWIVSLFYK